MAQRLRTLSSAARTAAAVLMALLIIGGAGRQLSAQEAGSCHALLIGGLGGEARYSAKFHKLLLDTRKALIENFLFPAENVVVLAESHADGEDFIDGISTAENIRKRFADLAGRAGGSDYVYIILFGHGSFDGKNARLNIPRRDLSDADYAELVAAVNAGRIVFINTASASFPFIAALSGQNRIIITATKSRTQRNVTAFPEFLAEGFSDPAADLDKNGSLSVLEVFEYAAEKTDRFYTDNNHLATEHAMLEDTGDGVAARLEELESGGEGAFAGATYLKRRISTVVSSGDAPKDSVLIGLLMQQERLELAVSNLKSRKKEYTDEEFYAQLEDLLVRLAKINDRLEKYKKIH